MVRFLTAFTIIFLAWTSGASAADVPLNSFFGKFRGTAVAETDASKKLDFAVRDLDVTVSPKGDGFEITWNSIQRPIPGSGSKVTKHENTVAFLAPNENGVYRAEQEGDPLSGGNLAWARIENRTLFVHVLTVGEKGAYELQSYARTILPDGSMRLLFTRYRDNERVRQVSGTLKRYQ
jgi:hypothetical protein